MAFGDPLPVLGWKPFSRKQLVYDLPFRRMAIVNDRATVEAVMLNRAGQFPKSAVVYELLRPLIGDGLFGQPGGDPVKETRRMLARALAMLTDERIASVTADKAAGYIEGWLARGDTGTAVSTDFSRMTVDIVSECTLGDCFDERESRRFTELFAIYHRKAKPLLLMLARNESTVRQGIVRELGLEEIGSEVRELIRCRFVGGAPPADPAPFRDALDAAGYLAPARSERALDEMAVMLLAGHETTASTLSWLAFELARHPDIQEQASAALSGMPAGMFSGLPPGEITAALTNETLRLYPPIGFFLRENTGELALEDANVPAGSLVVVSPRTLHRHSDYWSDAEAFAPKRWFEAPPPRGGFLPFGMGARVCPGSRFAGIELAAITRLLLTKTRLSSAGMKAPRPLWNLTSRPDRDVILKVEPRGPMGAAPRE